MLLATLLCHLCHIWSRTRFNKLCDGRKQFDICELNRWSVLFNEQFKCLTDWVVFEHGTLLVGSNQCVWVGRFFHCLVVQVGDQGIWRWMTGRISGVALTVILVPCFHQKDWFVCACVRAATSPDTTSACSTHTDNYSLRQQVWHTPSCIHMCLLSSRTSLFHWHGFEKREMTSSLSTHHPFDIIPQQINFYQGQCLLFPPIEEMNLTFNHIVFQDRKRF